jgi:hypothetical protein
MEPAQVLSSIYRGHPAWVGSCWSVCDG